MSATGYRVDVNNKVLFSNECWNFHEIFKKIIKSQPHTFLEILGT